MNPSKNKLIEMKKISVETKREIFQKLEEGIKTKKISEEEITDFLISKCGYNEKGKNQILKSIEVAQRAIQTSFEEIKKNIVGYQVKVAEPEIINLEIQKDKIIAYLNDGQ